MRTLSVGNTALYYHPRRNLHIVPLFKETTMRLVIRNHYFFL